MTTVEVKVPDIGDFAEVEVIELLVKPGDAVKAEQSLITVESDKASMEIPSTHAGVVKELKVKIGDKVNEGSLVMMLEAAGGAAASSPLPPGEGQGVRAAGAEPAPAPQPSPQPSPASGRGGNAVDVLVPDIGDFDEVAVIEVLVKAGDTIKAEQSLITVESDKASMEIPSSHAGLVKELKVKVGDKVKKGSLVAVVEAAGAAVSASPPSAPSPQPSPASGRA